MNDRPDELFLIDVDQEAKELAQYGAGAAELSSDRLTASLHYVSSLLISVNLHAHASFASSFARGAKRMEEGEARRTARDFAEILRRGIEAIRSDNQSDHDQDIPESLWERLPEAFRVDAAPASSALLDLERSDQTKPRSGSGVFEDAARTLAAADEFAALLRTRSLAATAVTSPASHASGLSRDISDDADRFAPEESSEPPEIAAAAGSVAKVDECFRRAVRVAEGDVQVWPPGMQALFDAIDELDRMPLEKALPWQVQLVGGAEAKISAQLAEALGKALDQARLRGELEALADAMVVSHTLILSLQCEEALNPTPLARFAANRSIATRRGLVRSALGPIRRAGRSCARRHSKREGVPWQYPRPNSRGRSRLGERWCLV